MFYTHRSTSIRLLYIANVQIDIPQSVQITVGDKIAQTNVVIIVADKESVTTEMEHVKDPVNQAMSLDYVLKVRYFVLR